MLQGAATRSACELRPHLTKRGRMLVNLICPLIYFYTDVLQECFSKFRAQCF